jgi:ribosomal protein S4E
MSPRAMDIELKLHNSWLGGEKIEGIKFLHNTYVEVTSGEHQGETGSVVSLVQLGDHARDIVEKESGFDIEVAENEITEKNS